jgi:hypothetical protein
MWRKTAQRAAKPNLFTSPFNSNRPRLRRGHWQQKLGFASLIGGQGSAAKADASGALVPDQQHGSGVRDHWHGGSLSSKGEGADPVGEILKQSQPVRASPIFRTEGTNMATGKINRKQRKELARQVQSVNPGLEVVHPRAGRHRRRQHCALCGGASRAGQNRRAGSNASRRICIDWRIG